MLDAIALGELLIDFATVDTDRDGYPTLAAHPGGAPGNFLAALHAYGCSGAMLGKVGADTFGDLLCATLAQAGIRTEGIVRDPSVFTTLAFVTFGPGGERAFSFARKPGADTQLRFDELDLSLLDEARLLHFGSLSLTQEPVRSATQQAAAYAAAHGKLLSFDPNLRLPLWPDAEAAKTQILWGLRQADIVKISDDEVRFLWSCGPEEGACLRTSASVWPWSPAGRRAACCRMPGQPSAWPRRASCRSTRRAQAISSAAAPSAACCSWAARPRR